MAKVIYIGDNVVELCEKLLALAKEGRITSIAIATESHKEGDTSTSFALGHFYDIGRLLGAVSMMQARLMREVEGVWDDD